LDDAKELDNKYYQEYFNEYGLNIELNDNGVEKIEVIKV
jgi:hypothetical protein